ncbi:MAG TPA: multidrug efflux SMR transporter [Ignavibacteriales bacterium]|nr:multidrug efflux SMR transporter [Ignavibacteriales bacterium]HEX3073057.1 multidrug efflux SMR transporter [Ignavibacteriales bacterium]
MHWLYLLIASLLEVGWIYSLKFTEGFTKVVPLIFYGLFGFGSAFFLARSLTKIPIGIAYASWMGIAMIGSSVLGIFVYKEPYELMKLFFMALIIIGIAGLKFTSAG